MVLFLGALKLVRVFGAHVGHVFLQHRQQLEPALSSTPLVMQFVLMPPTYSAMIFSRCCSPWIGSRQLGDAIPATLSFRQTL